MVLLLEFKENLPIENQLYMTPLPCLLRPPVYQIFKNFPTPQFIKTPCLLESKSNANITGIFI